ncbi:prenyltransferase/squalene oxidase repeat-containing protein [Rubritalea tangerina]|uniref:Prenyltransferase/squalene oxidase repeat-containing protein n=1 Tax=Rubritalea tangerina TaxID=430798 RepID=A0ABW4Z6Y5_9BACT
MSLHAQMSPEAKARLAAQKRTSTITSILIALLGCALVAIILMVIALTINVKNPPEIISYSSGVMDDDQIERPEMTNQVERKPSSPSSSMAKVIASTTASPTAVPVPDIEITEPSLDFGNGDDFGDGWGDGDGDGGGGGGFGRIPSSMKKRCSKADRLARLKKEGGKPECEEAVVRSLRYLQNTQNANGSWCRKNSSAMTGLALLAYLGHCETPLSPEFGETVEKAITYLVQLGIQNGGQLAEDRNDKHWPYEHGIATYALCEAYTFCKTLNITIPNLDKVVIESVGHIVSHQHTSGGWVYAFEMSNGPGDTSVSCWQIQALKASKHTGLQIDGLNGAMKKSMKYLTESQNGDGTIGYRGKKHSGLGPTMTGGGLLCLQQGGYGRRSQARSAAKWLSKNLKYNYANDADLYAHYYNGQALINYGGTVWKNYNKLFMDEHLSGQNPDGSWKSPGTNKGSRRFQGGSAQAVHYRTCLATLMLEVYYRFLPGSAQ